MIYGGVMTPRARRIVSPGSNEPLQRQCERCSRTLEPRQKRFCSDACRFAWWDAEHPRINRGPEGPRKDSIKHALLGVMSDGEWRTVHQLAEEVRAFPHSVSARLAELRRDFRVETDARNGNSRRAHRFRLVLG